MNSPDAEAIFTAWAVRVERGEAADFEALLREHPAHAEPLRRLHRDWELFAPLLSRIVPGLLANELAEAPSGEAAHAPNQNEASDERFFEALGLRLPHESRYRFRSVVGRGGSGVVLRVWDAKLGRDLAMKVVLGGDEARGVDSPQFGRRALSRFVAEARIAGRLDHPGIVPVHELGADEQGRGFFTMKLVEGRTLADLLRDSTTESARWSKTRLVGVLLRVCEAVSYAHDRGVLHRDLKPSNVVVGSFGEVYVMDWGLARVVGRPDPRDLRLRSAPTDGPDELLSAAAGRGSSEADSLVTMDGTVLGTPAYMSPEQAHGKIEALGPTTDVYSIGAMLYEILAGHPPYLHPSWRRSPREVLAALLNADEDPLDVSALRASDELASICSRAMARDSRVRYASAKALGEDLRAYLEGRSVAAHPTRAWQRAWKWTQRNRAVAALLACVATSCLVGLVLWWRNQRLRQEFELTMALAGIQSVRAAADELWPLEPAELPRMRSWLNRANELRERATVPEGERAGLIRRIEEVRARARPWSEAERLRDGAEDPDLREWIYRRRQAEVTRANLVSRARGAKLSQPPAHALDSELEVLSTVEDYVALAKSWCSPERPVFGREIEGWALAECALELAGPGELWRAHYVATQAALVNGHDDEARAHLQNTLLFAPEIEHDGMSTLVPFVERTLAELGAPGTAPEENALLAELERACAEVEARLGARRTYKFDDAQDAELHDSLLNALEGPRSLFDRLSGVVEGSHPDGGWSVAARVAFLEASEQRLQNNAEFIERWRLAVADLHEHLAAGQPGIDVTPRGDLLPLGRDRRSGLYEFGFLPSGDPPKRYENGRWGIEGSTCAVLVLVPGGSFASGAQNDDPASSNFDPDASSNERANAIVTLEPYLISKYEWTQGQWWRLSGDAPSAHAAKFANRFSNPDDRHPVEQVSARNARAVLNRFGLDLPTEAQWEHAARAGTTTPWHVGNDRRLLAGYANLADRYLPGHGGPRDLPYEDWLDDGHGATAPVGSYAPNGFGLFDVCGNVAELTRDDFDSFGLEARVGDGEWTGADGTYVARRGGSMFDLAVDCRSARRVRTHPDARDPEVGIRPCLLNPWKRQP